MAHNKSLDILESSSPRNSIVSERISGNLQFIKTETSVSLQSTTQKALPLEAKNLKGLLKMILSTVYFASLVFFLAKLIG